MTGDLTADAVEAVIELMITCDTSRATGAEGTARADEDAGGATEGEAGSEGALEGTTTAAATKVGEGEGRADVGRAAEGAT